MKSNKYFCANGLFAFLIFTWRWYYYDIRCAILVYDILKILPTCIQTIMVANDNDGDIFLSKDALIEI